MEAKRIVVTGGAGFIGSNFLRYMLKRYPSYKFINIDKLTYSGNLANLKDIENSPNYTFYKLDICNKEEISKIIKEGDIIVNFAAESHVDNSISNPGIFVKTNVLGTQTLLEVSRENSASLFLQISTDEVYGSLNFDSPSSKEDSPIVTSSPYSASKAAAEMLVIAAHKTYNQPVMITRTSNNYGPYQFPEKVIPLFITNLIQGKKVPVYGTGKNIRDWIHVLDNCRALDLVIHQGKIGEIYNIGGGNELTNIDLTHYILEEMKKNKDSINFVPDRKGHDLRYSVDSSKIRSLGFKPEIPFKEGLKETISWYKQNSAWWEPLKTLSGKRTS